MRVFVRDIQTNRTNYNHFVEPTTTRKTNLELFRKHFWRKLPAPAVSISLLPTSTGAIPDVKLFCNKPRF